MRSLGRAVAVLMVVGAIAAALTGCTGSTGGSAPSLSGDLAAHDPALAVGAAGQPSFVYSTGDPAIDGGGIEIRRSDDGIHWSRVGSVFAH
jgi:arabinan endo-1,5-alpha-L-arabinosidase